MSKYKQLKTIFVDNWRESTNFRVDIMNSKRQENGKLGHVVYKFTFAICRNAMLNLRNVK